MQWSATKWYNWSPTFQIYINDFNSNIDIKNEMSLFGEDTEFSVNQISLYNLLKITSTDG